MEICNIRETRYNKECFICGGALDHFAKGCRNVQKLVSPGGTTTSAGTNSTREINKETNKVSTDHCTRYGDGSQQIGNI